MIFFWLLAVVILVFPGIGPGEKSRRAGQIQASEGACATILGNSYQVINSSVMAGTAAYLTLLRVAS